MRNFKQNPNTFCLIGKAGEYAVATQLMIRDVVPFFPAVDRGVDLMAENGCRIQVKSAHRCSTPVTLRKNLEGVYRFSFKRGVHRASSERGAIKSVRFIPARKLSEYCDVVALWGIDQNRFWVVPSKLLDGIQGIDLGQYRERAFSKDVAEMREMVKLGYSQKEIGEHFGISDGAVCVRLKRAGTEVNVTKQTAAIRACENAWEHIINFGQPSTFESLASSVELQQDAPQIVEPKE